MVGWSDYTFVTPYFGHHTFFGGKLIDFPFFQVIIGFFLACVITWLSYRFHLLSRNGALGALILGTVIFGFGGLPWAILLMGFFISSSGLSKLLSHKKSAVNEKYAKGSTRDMGQVFANGGIAGLFVILHLIFPTEAFPWMAFAGTLAAVNADTWATELGVFSKSSPIHMITGKKVEKGTSGGISIEGTLAALLGSLLIGVLAIIFCPVYFTPLKETNWLLHIFTIGLAGLFGSLVDSFLGATFQKIYYCPVCKKETERFPKHVCGSNTEYLRGWHWLNNDWVNVFCGLAGGLMMLLVTL
jgi:uncharacterized protein (TIGR00297 family)